MVTDGHPLKSKRMATDGHASRIKTSKFDEDSEY